MPATNGQAARIRATRTPGTCRPGNSAAAGATFVMGVSLLTPDGLTRAIQDDTGIRPIWAAEAFNDPDEEVRYSKACITAGSLIPHRTRSGGLVLDVAAGKLNEVV